MSFSILIKAIQERPELWLSSHDNYKDKSVTNATWQELSENLDIELKILKTRWNMLKELYKKELRKMALYSATDAEEWHSGWMYFEEMAFLKDEMQNLRPSRRKYRLQESKLNKSVKTEENKQHIIKNYSIEKLFDNDHIIDDFMNDDFEFQVFTSFSPFLINMMFDASFEDKMDSLDIVPMNTFLEEILAVENKKVQLMKSNVESLQAKKRFTEDPELMYFNSILPFIKKMTVHQKLQFRNRINEILEEILSQNK